MQKIIQKFEQDDDKILSNKEVCCRIVPADLLGRIIPSIPKDDRIILVSGEGAVHACKKYELDGVVVHIDFSKPIKKQIVTIQEELGKKYLGVVCPPKRHEAMLCSECEPDFLVFEANSENKSDILSVVPWYNELFLIQCALDIQYLYTEYMTLDTDFIIVNAQNSKNFGC